MTIQVLGSGCKTCKKLFEMTTEVVSEIGVDEEVEYVTDVTKIIEMGIMQSPVLAINGTAVMIGFSDNRDKIRALIVENMER